MSAKRDDAASSDVWSKSSDRHVTDFERPKSPLGPQVGAWALWLVALALEACSVLYATDALNVPGLEIPVVPVVIVGLVLALVLSLLAARLWKSAARLSARAKGCSPSKSASSVGVIMSCVAFVPMILFFVTAKNADKKTVAKAALGCLVVVAALVAASLCL